MRTADSPSAGASLLPGRRHWRRRLGACLGLPRDCRRRPRRDGRPAVPACRRSASRPSPCARRARCRNRALPAPPRARPPPAWLPAAGRPRPQRRAATAAGRRETIAGHSLGHYLTACSADACRRPGDPECLRPSAAYIVAELGACQRARGDGYVAALHPPTTESSGATEPGTPRHRGDRARRHPLRPLLPERLLGARSTTGTSSFAGPARRRHGTARPTEAARRSPRRWPPIIERIARAARCGAQMQAVLGHRIRRHERGPGRGFTSRTGERRWLAVAERLYQSASSIRVRRAFATSSSTCTRTRRSRSSLARRGSMN